MSRFHIAFSVVLSVLFLSPVLGQDAAQKNEMMRKEHSMAATEHQQWEAKVGKMRVEHRRALAALAQLRAEILAHDAELEAIAEHIRSHKVEMSSHDHALAHKGDKPELATAHGKIMEDHKSLGQALMSEMNHHSELISGIMEFTQKHMKAHHPHQKNGAGKMMGKEGMKKKADHSHADHDHDHSKKK